jgi:hypothetical protein
MSKQLKKKNKIIAQNLLSVRIKPQAVVFLFFIFWLYLTLIKTNYFQHFPLPFTPTGLFENLSFSFNKTIFLLKSFIYAFISIFCCFGYGSILVEKYFSEFTYSKKIVLSLVLGFGFVSLLIFFLGIIGLIYFDVFLVLVILGVFFGVLNCLKNIKNFVLPKFNFIQFLFLVVLLYSTCVNLLGALTPETFFDSQFYLLGLPNIWKLQHKISFIPYIFASLYPFNINMFYLLNLVLSNDISAKIIHWFCGIISVVLIYIFVKEYFSKTTALVACLIFYTVPTVMAVSWKTAIELGISMFELAGIFCLIEYFSKEDKKYLFLSSIFWGFALGSKYLVLLEFFSILLTFFVYNLIVNKKKLSLFLKDFVVFIFLSGLVASVWYIRNVILTGNPVFPFFAHKIGFVKPRIVGNIFSDPPPPKFSFKNYFLFLWPLTLAQLQQESFPGAVFLVFLPFLFLFKNIDKKIKFLIMYSVSCLVLWAFIGRFYLRYFIPVIGVVATIYAYFVVESNLSKNFKNFLYLLLLFIITSNINFAERILHFTQTPAEFVFSDMSVKEYLFTQRPSYPCPYYSVVDWANKNLSKENNKILFLGETRGLFCEIPYLTHGVLEYSPLIKMLEKVKNEDELYEEFKKQGITHILLNLPEAKRLAGYDNFYFEPQQFEIWLKFWDKYVEEVYKDIADISLPDRGIFSMKKQNPQWWQIYSSDHKNYVYLYKILSEEEIKLIKEGKLEHKKPINFFLMKELYSEPRWEKILKDVAEKYVSY